jgi:hypothetical protein
MKSLIDHNKDHVKISETSDIKINTSEMLTKYITKFGVGYVIRHYELNPCLIPLIADGDYSDRCDEVFTTSEIVRYQNALISSIHKSI